MRATLKNTFARHMFTIGNPDLVNPIPVIDRAWNATVLPQSTTRNTADSSPPSMAFDPPYLAPHISSKPAIGQ